MSVCRCGRNWSREICVSLVFKMGMFDIVKTETYHREGGDVSVYGI